jgi:hypothetical protein
MPSYSYTTIYRLSLCNSIGREKRESLNVRSVRETKNTDMKMSEKKTNYYFFFPSLKKYFLFALFVGHAKRYIKERTIKTLKS